MSSQERTSAVHRAPLSQPCLRKTHPSHRSNNKYGLGSNPKIARILFRIGRTSGSMHPCDHTATPRLHDPWQWTPIRVPRPDCGETSETTGRVTITVLLNTYCMAHVGYGPYVTWHACLPSMGCALKRQAAGNKNHTVLRVLRGSGICSGAAPVPLGHYAADDAYATMSQGESPERI